VLPDPSLFLSKNASPNTQFTYYLFPIADTAGNPAGMQVGAAGAATARSINVVDSLSWIKGKHAMKFGVDYRYYTPSSPALTAQIGDYFETPFGAGMPYGLY